MCVRFKKFAFVFVFAWLLCALYVSSVFAAANAKPGDVIVVFRNNSSVKSLSDKAELQKQQNNVSSMVKSMEASIEEIYPALSRASNNIFTLIHSDTKTEDELLEEFSSNPDVLAVSPNYEIHALAKPNDTYYRNLWGMSKIAADQLWDAGITGNSDVYVAVLDSGIDYTHPDLKDNFETSGYSRNFTTESSYKDGDGHGTHVAGTIGAVGNNGKGVAGVNWKVKLIALKVLDDNGRGSTSLVIKALDYLTGLLQSNPDMKLASVNLSLGGYSSISPTITTSNTEWRAYKALSDLDRAVICVAAGNENLEVGVPAPYNASDGKFYKGEYCYPASFRGIDNLIVVGASAYTSTSRASFSNYSTTYVDVAAPGSLIYSTLPDNSYTYYSGTSMATPHVAGMAALLKSAFPSATASQIKSAIINGADSSAATSYTHYGYANVKGAYDILASLADVPSITTESFDCYAGYAFTGQLELSESVSATWKALTTMPSGLKLNANTGAITGKPSRAGEYTVTFQATTSVGASTKDVTIVIYDKPIKPTIKTSSLAQGNVDTEYSQEIVITGTDPITVTVTGLPNGLSVNSSTGYISGTPSAAGTYSVKITAENIATELENKPVTKTLKLVIKAQAPVIDFTDDALPDAKVGESYSYTFSISSGTGPFTWKVSGLPSGMKFSSGTLSGTPTKAGDFKITLTVSNSGGKETLKVPLTVLQAPVITAPKLANATTDKKYSAKISAKGTTPITWEIDGLPDTLTYSYNAQGTTLTITGTPEEIATYALTITATSAAGSSSVSANLKVNGVAPKLKATLAKGYVGSDYTGSNISATGTKPITFAYSISQSDRNKFGINSLDDLGLSFNYDADEATASITGTPTGSVKALPITITAENAASNGKAVSKTVKLTIAGQKPAFTEPDASSVTLKVQQKESVSVNFTVTGTPDITFSMNKISGFTLTKTGDYTATLSGTAPSKDGKTTITVTASNADGKATRKVIIQTFTAPKITTSSLSAGTLNKNYSAKLAVTGTKTITWTLDGELPDGMKFNKGSFSGKPKEAGTFALSVTAENDIGTDTQEFTLTVKDPNNTKAVAEEAPENVNELYAYDESLPEDTEVNAEAKAESESESAITFGSERNANSLSAGQSAMLNDEGYVIAKVLPEMKVSESAMYDIEVELDESIETGAKLIWFAFPKDYESSSDDEIAEFYDESGAEIDCVPESHKFTVGAWLNEGITYEPVIAVKSEK